MIAHYSHEDLPPFGKTFQILRTEREADLQFAQDEEDITINCVGSGRLRFRFCASEGTTVA